MWRAIISQPALISQDTPTAATKVPSKSCEVRHPVGLLLSLLIKFVESRVNLTGCNGVHLV